MRILVTGARGFIGRHLAGVLRAAGHAVRGSGRGPGVGADSGFLEWSTTGAIGRGTDWTSALAEVDVVVHLAGIAHRVGTDATHQVAEFHEVNAEGTATLARAVAASPTVRRLVFLSSVGAVCSSSPEVVTSATRPAPDTAYGRSKLAGEAAIAEILAGTGADWCILRPPLIYGPGNPGNMARLFRLLRTGLPLPFAGLQGMRSFLYVGNLVALIHRVLEHPGASRQVLLVDDGLPVSTVELFRQIGLLSGRPTRLFRVSPALLRALGRAGDVAGSVLGNSIGFDSLAVQRLEASLVIDSSRTWELLNWRPRISFHEALRMTLEVRRP